MVNMSRSKALDELDRVAKLLWLYIVVVIGTIAALAILSAVGSAQATSDAWVHAVIVGVFAAVLQLRLRAARQGSRRATIAVGVIAVALLVVNVVEALIPGLFPSWMRVEMFGIAALMAVVALLVLRPVLRGRP
jgi:peptidoglycan/LPS O-acetylase OafA/YrhL